MKELKLILAVSIALITSSTLWSQKSNNDIPNFFLAEDANPIIQFVLPGNNSVTHKTADIVQVDRLKKVDDFETLGNATFNTLCMSIENRLNELGIQPFGFVKRVGYGAIERPGEIKKLTEEMMQNKIQYIIYIEVQNWGKMSKVTKKDNHADVLPYGKSLDFFIQGISDQTIQASYKLEGIHGMDDTFNQLENDINAKDDNYFIEKIGQPEYSAAKRESEQAEMYLKITTNSNQYIRKWPSSEALSKKNVLVIFDGENQKSKAESELSIGFPYKYDFITTAESINVEDGNYDFVLVPYKKSLEGYRSTSGTQYSGSTVYHYVLKDLNSQDLFVGPNKDDIVNNGRTTHLKALKVFLKMYSK